MALYSRTVGQDIRKLGTLVGNILKAQTSTDTFETVEHLRTTAIDYRSDERDSHEALNRTLRGLDPKPRSRLHARSPPTSKW